MTDDERNLITQFVARVGAAPAPSGGSVPGAVAPAPPVDRDADALLADLFNRYPEARYRITQLAYVQEHALVEAQNRMSRLTWELQQAQQAGPQGVPSQGGEQRGFFSSLFGGGGSAAARPAAVPPPPQYPPQYQQQPPQYAAAPPPPSYPPGYNPGLFQQQGPGFFGSALRTAAGVAGGVLAADALMSLFSPHSVVGGGFGGLGGGFGGAGVENVTINNPPVANPWGGDSMDQGGQPKDFDAGSQSAWSPPADQSGGGGGWQDAPPDQGQARDSGWQDASSDQSSDDSGWQDASSDDSGGGSDWSDNS